MKENFEQTPENKKVDEKGDFSAFAENYQRKTKEAAEIEDQVSERRKFLEQEKNPETVKNIHAEILALEKKKKKLQYEAGIELNNHKWSTEVLEDIDPDTIEGKA